MQIQLDKFMLESYTLQFMEQYTLSELEDILAMSDSSPKKQQLANEHVLLISELDYITSCAITELVLDATINGEF